MIPRGFLLLYSGFQQQTQHGSLSPPMLKANGLKLLSVHWEKRLAITKISYSVIWLNLRNRSSFWTQFEGMCAQLEALHLPL